MFRSCKNRGFQIQFSNGYRISCQFGLGNYCSGKYEVTFDVDDLKKERSAYTNTSEDCEVAILKDNDFVTERILEDMKSELECSEPDVIGYVSPDDVGKIISYLVNLKD